MCKAFTSRSSGTCFIGSLETFTELTKRLWLAVLEICISINEPTTEKHSWTLLLRELGWFSPICHCLEDSRDGSLLLPANMVAKHWGSYSSSFIYLERTVQMMRCCVSLPLFFFYAELEPTNVRKNSHGSSQGIVQVFLPQLCWCDSV